MADAALASAPESEAGVFNVQPCLGDPVCWLLKERWRLDSPRVGLLFFVVYLGGNFLAALIDRDAFPRPGLELPFTHDLVGLVLYGFLVPVGILLAFRFYGQIERAFETIYAQGLVEAPLAEYNAFLRQLHRRYNAPALHVAGLLIALGVFGLLTYRNEVHAGKAWLDLDAGAGGIVHFALGLVAWYSAAIVILKIAVTTRALYRLFDWPVNIQPLHPDGCGGFRLFTDVAVTIALFTAILGLAVVLFVLAGVILYHSRIAMGPVVATVGLEALSPLLFFAFLYRAHSAMAAAKRTMLSQIHSQFQTPFAALREGLQRGRLEGEVGGRIVELNDLYGVVQRLPVWPTNTEILFQVATSVAVPLALLGLQLLIDHFTR